MRWRQAISDGSAWVADPEPLYHLAAWRDEAGGGWDWYVLLGASGTYPRKVGQTFGRLESNANDARHAAEVAYRRHVERTAIVAPAAPPRR